MSTSSIQPEGSRQLCRQTFRGNHVDVFWSVAYTPDGRYIVSGSSSRDQPLLLWDVDKGEVVGKPFRAHSDPVHAAAVTPDGKTVISGSSDHTIRIWDLDSRRIIHTIETPASITSFALLPNGRHLVSASLEESAIRIWDIETGRSTMGPLEGHTGHVGAVVYSSDGKKLASCSWDDTVRVWDAATGRLMAGPFQVGRIYSIALSHDGRQFIYGGDQGKIQIRDAEDGRLVSQPLVKHKDGVLCLALSPDGGRIASGSYDHTVCIWDITTCKLIAGPFDGHTGGIHAVTYSPDAKFVASASDDETIRVWDVEAGVRAREILAANRPEQTDGVPHTSHAMTEHAGRQRAHHRTQPSQITQPSGSIPRADSLDSLILNLPATLPERTQGRNAMDHEDHDWDSFLETPANPDNPNSTKPVPDVEPTPRDSATKPPSLPNVPANFLARLQARLRASIRRQRSSIEASPRALDPQTNTDDLGPSKNTPSEGECVLSGTTAVEPPPPSSVPAGRLARSWARLRVRTSSFRTQSQAAAPPLVDVAYGQADIRLYTAPPRNGRGGRRRARAAGPRTLEDSESDTSSDSYEYNGWLDHVCFCRCL